MILSKKSKNAYKKPLKKVFIPKIVEYLPETKEEMFNDKGIGDIMQIEEPKKKTKKKNNKE